MAKTLSVVRTFAKLKAVLRIWSGVSSLGVRHRHMLDAHVADPAGGFAANPDGRKPAVAERAVRDQHVLGGFGQLVAFHPAPRLDRNRIITRVDVALIDDDVPARIHVDAVSAGAADREAPRNHVLAVNQVDRPHVRLLGGEVLEADVPAIDRLDEHGAGGHAPCADHWVPDDGDVFGVLGGDERPPAIDPIASPTRQDARCSL